MGAIESYKEGKGGRHRWAGGYDTRRERIKGWYPKKNNRRTLGSSQRTDSAADVWLRTTRVVENCVENEGSGHFSIYGRVYTAHIRKDRPRALNEAAGIEGCWIHRVTSVEEGREGRIDGMGDSRISRDK